MLVHVLINIDRKHTPGAKIWTCDFCPGDVPKEFDRCDNFRDHLKRHLPNSSSGTRTQRHEGAALLLAQLQSEMKTKKKRVTKAEPIKEIKAELFSPPLSSIFP